MWPAGGSFWLGLLATEEGHPPEGRSSCGDGGQGTVTWHLVGAQCCLPGARGHRWPVTVLQRRQLRLTHIHFGFSFDNLEGLNVILWGGEETPLLLRHGDMLFPARGRLGSREPFPGPSFQGQRVPR